jgi:hypothetical protein
MRAPFSLLPFLVDLEALGPAARLKTTRGDDSAPPQGLDSRGYLDWATRRAAILYGRFYVFEAWKLQQGALASLGGEGGELVGQAYLNLAVYEASQGHLDKASRALRELAERMPRGGDRRERERIWLGAEQLEAVMASIRGRQREAFERQRAVVAGFARCADGEPDHLRSRLVMAGLLVRLQEYARAKEEAAQVAVALEGRLPNEPVAMLLPNLIMTFADVGLDRFGAAASRITEARSRLGKAEFMTPPAVFANYVNIWTRLQTPGGDLQGVLGLGKLNPVFTALWGERGEVAHTLHLLYAIALVGFGQTEEMALVIEQLGTVSSGVEQDLTGIEEDWQAWRAQLRVGDLVLNDRLDEAIRVTKALHSFHLSRLGSEAIATLSAASDAAMPLALAGRTAEALAFVESALSTSRRVRGDLHPETLRLAAVALMTMTMASVADVANETGVRGRTRDLYSLFDMEIKERGVVAGYARLHQGVFTWEVAKVFLRLNTGDREGAQRDWPEMRRLLELTYGPHSNYGATLISTVERMLRISAPD